MQLWEVVAGLAIVAVVAFAGYLLRTVDEVGSGFRRTMRRPRTWIIGIPVILVGALVGVPFAYLQSVTTESAAELTFADLPEAPGTTAAPPDQPPASDAAASAPLPTEGSEATTSTAPTTAPDAGTAPPTSLASVIHGTWTVGPGSQARYGVDDTILGQTARVVGTTEDVTGSMVVEDLTVSAVDVTVNMQTVRCGCVHDSKYHDLLETGVYPTSRFQLTQPIVLDAVPPDGEVLRLRATGRFTIRGNTRELTFPLEALREGERIAVKGVIPVDYRQFNIPNANAGPLGGLSNYAIELLIAFVRPG